MKKVVEVINKSGLHARPAAVFVKTASQFKSEINIEFNGSNFSAKSIMSILSMGVKKGDKITIVAEGTDEKEAMDALIGLIESKFGEE